MALVILLIVFTTINSIVSFDLTLNIDGSNNYFPFVEIAKPNAEYSLPNVIILDDEHNPKILNSSCATSVKTYHLESNENFHGFATVIHGTSTDNNLLFAMVQIPNGTFYDISSPMSIKQTKTKRSVNNAYIIRSKESIIAQAYVTIDWNSNRERRAIDETESTYNSSDMEVTTLQTTTQMDSSTLLPVTVENITISSAENDTELLTNATMTTTTLRPVSEKSRHLYLE
ncbi:unnamed protein product, partial [Rotaria magnacalcarata]